jgi:hypothetical protein
VLIFLIRFLPVQYTHMTASQWCFVNTTTMFSNTLKVLFWDDCTENRYIFYYANVKVLFASIFLMYNLSFSLDGGNQSV